MSGKDEDYIKKLDTLNEDELFGHYGIIKKSKRVTDCCGVFVIFVALFFGNIIASILALVAVYALVRIHGALRDLELMVIERLAKKVSR